MSFKIPKFVPGKTYIPATGKVYGKEEIQNAIKVAKEGVWTEGRYTEELEARLRNYMGVKYAIMTNSGSSANLLAVAALTSRVFGEKRLKPGDEFITTSVAFPTTVNPGIFYGLKPVFLDAELDTMNIDLSKIEKAITKKTRLIMIAHALGKPYDLDIIKKIVKKHELWFIEDNCDAFGSRYDGQLTGTHGHISTQSFYPAHHITMGEGGAIYTNNPLIKLAIKQFRDWGRDCWCAPGEDNTCGKRFNWQLGDLPFGYDHKYIYSQIGFNLKLTDFQAAIGLAQLDRFPEFMRIRKANFQRYYQFFSLYDDYFIVPRITEKEDPSWYAFALVVKNKAPFTRNELTTYLEDNQIGTRPIFSGNLLRHPAYKDIKYRKMGNMKNADMIMNNAFFIGIYPGIDEQRQQYVMDKIKAFIDRY